MPTGQQAYLSCFQEAGKPPSTLYTWRTSNVHAFWEWKHLEEQNPFWTSELGSSTSTVETLRTSPLTSQREVMCRGCIWCSPHQAISYSRARSLAPGTTTLSRYDKPLRSHDVIATMTRYTLPTHFHQIQFHQHKTSRPRRRAHAPTRR